MGVSSLRCFHPQTALGNGLAMLALITALREGVVVVVAPIAGSFPLFTLLTSLLFFRQERFTPRILAAVFLVIASVAAITIMG